VADFYPAGGDQARLRWIIIDALRRYGTDSGRIGHAFAELQRLQAADLRALVAIMSAEGNGTPLTAGQLREQLGLSSGGASLVIDRLEHAGHIRRARDHPADNRVVHLRYTDQGKATGLAFFGSLGDRAHAILDGFTDDELQVIARFISAMADSARQQVQELEGRLPGVRSAVPEEAAARPVVGQGGGPHDPRHAVGDRPGAHGLGAGPGRGEVGVEGVDDDGGAVEFGRLDQTETLAEPADLAAALDADPAACRHWDAFPRSARRAILEWIGNARPDATRQARIERTVSDAARGIRANQWRQPKRPAGPGSLADGDR